MVVLQQFCLWVLVPCARRIHAQKSVSSLRKADCLFATTCTFGIVATWAIQAVAWVWAIKDRLTEGSSQPSARKCVVRGFPRAFHTTRLSLSRDGLLEKAIMLDCVFVSGIGVCCVKR